MFLKILGGLAILIVLDYGAVRLAQRIAMPDIPERVPAEIDWTGPIQQLREVKRALLIYRYQTSYEVYAPDNAVEYWRASFSYVAPRSLFDISRLIFTFDYVAEEFVQQQRLKTYKYLEQVKIND